MIIIKQKQRIMANAMQTTRTAQQFQMGTIEINHPANSKETSELVNGGKQGFKRVDFNPPLPSNVTPLVFVNVQTFEGVDTPGVRIQEVSEAGFYIRMNELVIDGKPLGIEKRGGIHSTETIAWIAIG